MMLKISGPGIKPNQEYYSCRYTTLREPLGFPRGAEILADDQQAIHAYVELEGEIVAVGRAHLIAEECDGSQSDYAGVDAPKSPPFGPLQSQKHRPAVQIRQMGTKSEYRRRGLAAIVLAALEKHAREVFEANYGFLQARVPAITFYESQGWSVIDEPYEVIKVGPHRSMMKQLF